MRAESQAQKDGWNQTVNDPEGDIQEFILFPINHRESLKPYECVQDISRTVLLKIMLTHCGVDQKDAEDKTNQEIRFIHLTKLTAYPQCGGNREQGSK